MTDSETFWERAFLAAITEAARNVVGADGDEDDRARVRARVRAAAFIATAAQEQWAKRFSEMDDKRRAGLAALIACCRDMQEFLERLSVRNRAGMSQEERLSYDKLVAELVLRQDHISAA